MSTSSESHLRLLHRAHSLEGEELYAAGRYAPAAGCFNDAKFALLIIAGLSGGAAAGGPTRHAKLTDRINSAALTISEVQTEVKAEIKKQCSENTRNHKEAEEKEGIQAEVNNLNDLRNEATLSLARILRKKGSISAMFDNHEDALDSFAKSIAAWKEAANIEQQQGEEVINRNTTDLDDHSLILETYELICSEHQAQDSSKPPSHDTYSLKNTIHLKALTTALQMAKSHHAVAVEMAMSGKEGITSPREQHLDPIRVSVAHHLYAMKLIFESRRLRTALHMSSSRKRKSKIRFIEAANMIMVANRVVPVGGRLTTHGRDLGVLMNEIDSEDIVDNVEGFIKRCTLLMVQQQVCISQACSRLSLWNLSDRWLSDALDNTDKLGLSKMKEKVKANLHIISIKKDNKLQDCSSDRVSLYQGGLSIFSRGHKEDPRLFIHLALALLEKELQSSAMTALQKIKKMYEIPTTPTNYDELLHASNAQIIIRVKEGDMDGALQGMHRRLNAVSNWIGDTSFEMAHDLYRLACFYSILGHHIQCAKHLVKSLDIGRGYELYDTLAIMKLLAVTYDNMYDKGKVTQEKVISQYECALRMEGGTISQARLINALSHLLIRIGGQSQLAIEYLEKSTSILQNDTNMSTIAVLLDAKILYGNALVSEESYSRAIEWYESALNLNPDKSAIHPTNLRALFNKGIALFRNRDRVGAAHAFEIISREVDKNATTAPSEATIILNEIGCIYFINENFVGALGCFALSLSLKNGCVSASQRAGTLCNVGSAYYKMQSYKESEQYFHEAAESLGESSSGLKGTIMVKLAYILYRQKHYLRAHEIYSDAALIEFDSEQLADESKSTPIGDGAIDDEFSAKCEGWAEYCYIQLKDQYFKLKATTITNQTTFDSDDKEKKLLSDSEENSTDNDSSSEKEHTTSGGLKGSSFVTRAFSSFMEVARSSQTKREELEENKDGLGQDELSNNSWLSNESVSFDGSDDDMETNTSSQENQSVGNTKETSEADEPKSPKKEHTAESRGGFKETFSIARAFSSFMEIARASQNKKEELEEIKKGLGQVELGLENNDCGESTIRAARTHIDVNDEIEAGKENADDPKEVASKDSIPTQWQEANAREPIYLETLINMTDEHNTARCRDAICPWNIRMLTALGVQHSNGGSVAFSSKDGNILCKKALKYLLKQTEDCQAKYTLEFEDFLLGELDSNFINMKSLLDKKLHVLSY